MPVSVTCPGCAKRYKVPDSKIGLAIPCKHCDTQIFVSDSGDDTRRLRTRREAATEMSEWDIHFRKSGIVLMILGLASFVLPLMGLQLRMFARLGDSAQLGGAIAAYVGVALFIYAMRREPLAAALGGGSVAAIVTVLAAPYLQQQNGAPAVAQQAPPQAVPGAAAPPAPQAAQPGQPQQPQQGRGPRPGFGSRPGPPFNRPEGFGPRNRGPGAGRPMNQPTTPGNPRPQNSRAGAGSAPTQVDLSSGQDNTPVNLLDVIQPSRDQLIGQWTLQNGVLTSPMMQPARISIPVTPPESYVLTIDAERLQGNDSLNIGLVVGGRGVSVVMDGYGGQVTGLNRLDGRTGDVNETTHRGKVLPNGRRNTIVCTVGPESVQVTANGRTVIDWKGSPQRLSRDHRWTPGRDDHLQIGCWATKWRISRLELTPLP